MDSVVRRKMSIITKLIDMKICFSSLLKCCFHRVVQYWDSKKRQRVSKAEAYKQTFHFLLLSHSFKSNILVCACKVENMCVQLTITFYLATKVANLQKLNEITINNVYEVTVMVTLLCSDEKLFHKRHMALLLHSHVLSKV